MKEAQKQGRQHRKILHTSNQRARTSKSRGWRGGSNVEIAEHILKLSKNKTPYISKELLILKKMCCSTGGQEELDANTPPEICSVLRESIEVQNQHVRKTCHRRWWWGDCFQLRALYQQFTGGGDVCLGSQMMGRQHVRGSAIHSTHYCCLLNLPKALFWQCRSLPRPHPTRFRLFKLSQLFSR